MNKIYLRPIYRHMMSLGTTGKVLRLVALIGFIAGVWYIVSRLYSTPKETEKESKLPKYIVHGKEPIVARDELVVEVPKLLRLDVFYEALCPDSRHYIIQQVEPTFKVLSKIMELQLVPYGKATTHTNADGTLSFTCQHGPKECLANKVHACVTHLVTESNLALKFISCMIDINSHAIDPIAAGKQCVPTEFWSAVKECSTTQKGDAILHHMGKLTHNLMPRVTFIPTVTVDGSQKRQNLLYKDLKSTLCNMYKGPKPSACS